MKTIIIYHQIKPSVDCPDGLAAAWVANRFYHNADVLGCSYQSDTPDVSSYDRIVIVDFSFPKNTIIRWQSEGKIVLLIDHHKTALEHLGSLADFANVIFDMQECGATLAWKTLFPDLPMPAFLSYIRDRDLWNFDLEDTEEIHEATAALKRSFALFDMLSLMSVDELRKFLSPLGVKLLEPKRKSIEKAFNRHEWGTIAGYENIPFVRLSSDEDRLTSDICSKLYKTFPNAHFVACITSDGTYSLRSDKNGNNTDVGSIATALGGGGHHNASGFKI